MVLSSDVFLFSGTIKRCFSLLQFTVSSFTHCWIFINRLIRCNKMMVPFYRVQRAKDYCGPNLILGKGPCLRHNKLFQYVVIKIDIFLQVSKHRVGRIHQLHSANLKAGNQDYTINFPMKMQLFSPVFCKKQLDLYSRLRWSSKN